LPEEAHVESVRRTDPWFWANNPSFPYIRSFPGGLLKDFYRQVRGVDILQVAQALGIVVLKGNKALCPLHGDKDPSLSFRNNRFKCFGCGENGSPIDLVMKMQNIGLSEAAEWIGSRFGVELPDRSERRSLSRSSGKAPVVVSPPPQKTERLSTSVDPLFYDIYAALLGSLPERSGEEWVVSRGFPTSVAREYSIKKIDFPSRVLKHLQDGWPESLLLASGVADPAREGKDIRLHWGPGWILLPVYGHGETGGRVVFLQGRNPLPDGKPKFKEPGGGFPRPLFWTNLARLVPEGGDLVLVEGLPDALAAELFNYPAVAILGVEALSNEIIRTLLPYRVKLASDMDSAGRKFALKAAERFEAMGRVVTIMELPDDAKDWNDLLKKANNVR